MSIYKRDSDKTKCMYFLIKDRRFFDKYSKIWRKVSNIIKKKKKKKRKLIYKNIYLKAEKNQHKRRLSLHM